MMIVLKKIRNFVIDLIFYSILSVGYLLIICLYLYGICVLSVGLFKLVTNLYNYLSFIN